MKRLTLFWGTFVGQSPPGDVNPILTTHHHEMLPPPRLTTIL